MTHSHSDEPDALSDRLPRRRPVPDDDMTDDDELSLHPIIAVLLLGSFLVLLGGGGVLITHAVLPLLSEDVHKYVWRSVGVALLIIVLLARLLPCKSRFGRESDHVRRAPFPVE